MRYVIQLKELKKNDAKTGGGKGANLGELLRGGFVVPGGFCVNSNGFRRFINHNNLQTELSKVVQLAKDGNIKELHEKILVLKELICTGAYPDDLKQEIEQMYTEILKGKRIAVRSSATAEDLIEASFAGQQETYLGVYGIKEMLDKIRECFASLYDDRAILYREKMGFNKEDVALAVVVQEMINSETAGITFTENPLNRNTDEMMINVSYGLGESIVSGKVTPDIYVYSKRDKKILSKAIGSKETAIYMNRDNGTNTVEVAEKDRNIYALNEVQIREVFEVCGNIECMYQMPMDIEWAYENGQLYILQARAITTLNTELKMKQISTDFQRATDFDNIVKQEKSVRMQMNNLIEHCPITPYPLDLGPFMTVMNAKQKVFAEHGIVQDDVLRMNDEGLIESDVKKPKYKASVIKLPFEMKGFLDFEVNYKKAEEAIETAKCSINAIDPEKVPEDDIQKTIAIVLEIARKIAYYRFRHVVFPYVCEAEFMEGSLHKVNPKLSNYDLMCNLSYKTWDMNQGLGKLADIIRRNESLKILFKRGMENRVYEDCLEKMCAASAEFSASYTSFMTEFGWNSDNSYVAFSTTSWNENKASFFSILNVLICSTASVKTESTKYASIIKEIEGSLSAKKAAKLKKKIENNRVYHVLREETLYLLEICYGYCRILLKRLLEGSFKGILSLEDALYLTETEICSIKPEQVVSFMGKIEIRKGNRKTNIIMWEGLEASHDDHSVSVINGISGNVGKVTAKVRIIQSISEFGYLKEGEVLVCRYTDPEWTPLFSLASAVVSDTGGPLSHSAIVAREFGIPAVLATGDATKRLYDGCVVEVDGDNGVVNVLA